MNDESEQILDKLEKLFVKIDELHTAVTRLQATPPNSPWLTIKDAAKEFGISPKTLRRQKHLHVRIGRSIRIRRASLERRDLLA